MVRAGLPCRCRDAWGKSVLWKTAALSVMLPLWAVALDRSDLLFHAPLDGTLDAFATNGVLRPGGASDVQFSQGVSGLGIIPKGDVAYKVGELLGSEGTLAFWVRAPDWRSGGGFMRFPSPGADNMIYITYYGAFRFYQEAPGYKLAIAETGAEAFTPGRWRFITATWRKSDIALYTDGVKLAGVDQNVQPVVSHVNNLIVIPGQASNEWDDVMLFRRALTREEIQGLFYTRAIPFHAATSTNEVADVLTGRISLGAGPEHAVELRGWNDRLLGLANDDSTAVRLWRQADGLRVEFTYPIPAKYRADRVSYQSKPLRGDAAADSPGVFDDDMVSVTLRPGRQAPTYRFALNGAGAAYDDRNGDAAWNGAWEHAANVDDNRWQANFTIPWADLGGAPEDDAVWGVNLQHHAAHLETSDSVWAAGTAGEQLGALRFAAAAPSVKVTALADPNGGSVYVAGCVAGGAGQTYTVRTEVVTTCLKALDPLDGFSKQDEMAPPGWRKEQGLDGKGDFSFRDALAKPLAADLVVSVSDATGREWYRQRRPFVYAVRRDVRLSPLPSMDRLVVELDAGGESELGKGLEVEIALKGPKGRVLDRRRIAAMTSVRQVAPFSMSRRAPGEYAVETQFSAGGVKETPIVRSFTQPTRPVWADTQVGLSDKVPEPWTPIKRDGDALEVWGRRIGVNGLLPSSLRILGEEILAGPMRVNLGSSGQDRVAAPATVKWGKVTDRRAEYRARAKSGPLTITAQNWLEFDGFMWVTLTIAGQGPLEGCSVEIPLKPEYARYWCTGGRGLGGYTPKEPYFSGPCGGMRIGSPDRGLQWCWENQQGWSLTNSKTAFQFIPGEKESLVRLTFVDHPVLIDGERTIQFGLHPLPAKPCPMKGWRKIWWCGPWEPDKWHTMLTVTLWNGEDYWMMSPHHNYPNLAENRIAESRKAALTMATWTNPTFHAYKHFDVSSDANTPEYRIYGEEWRTWPTPRPDLAAVAGKPDEPLWMPVCYNSKSYLDFYLYHSRRYLTAMRGPEKLPVIIYIDCAGPNTCSNPYHGCGWTDDQGVRQANWNILAQRRYMMRLNQMFRDLGDNTWITIHMSWNPLMAVWSFADMMMPGEEYAALFASERRAMDAKGEECPRSYIPYIDLARFRSMLASAAFGTPQAFLDQLYCFRNESDREEIEKDSKVLDTEKYKRGERHLSSLCIVHDTINWGGSQEESTAIRQQFGLDDNVTFHGYWQNPDLAKLDIFDEQKYVLSLMTRPERLLLIAFNNTDRQVTGTATLNLAKLGFPQAADGELLDLLSCEKVKLQGAKVAFVMPPRALRLLMFGQPWDWKSAVTNGTFRPW